LADFSFSNAASKLAIDAAAEEVASEVGVDKFTKNRCPN
jgi:hypothetical protein